MSQPHIPVRIPDGMTVPEIGQHIAALRHQFALSVLDVSERLHIRTRYIQAIEDGRLEQMPGTVYARGYVHTYAEFLGLDADQVVAQCFPAAAAAPLAMTNAPPARNAASMVRPRPGARHWRGLAITGVVAVIALLIITQLTGAEEKRAPEPPAVAPVPEALLDSVRTGLMPTPQNIDCLTGEETWLACFFADASNRTIAASDAYGFPEISNAELDGVAGSIAPQAESPADRIDDE